MNRQETIESLKGALMKVPELRNLLFSEGYHNSTLSVSFHIPHHSSHPASGLMSAILILLMNWGGDNAVDWSKINIIMENGLSAGGELSATYVQIHLTL